jgi:hypothetical protein
MREIFLTELILQAPYRYISILRRSVKNAELTGTDGPVQGTQKAYI